MIGTEDRVSLGGYFVSLMTNLNNALTLTSAKQVHDILNESMKQSVEMHFPNYRFMEALSDIHSK